MYQDLFCIYNDQWKKPILVYTHGIALWRKIQDLVDQNLEYSYDLQQIHFDPFSFILTAILVIFKNLSMESSRLFSFCTHPTPQTPPYPFEPCVGMKGSPVKSEFRCHTWGLSSASLTANFPHPRPLIQYPIQHPLDACRIKEDHSLFPSCSEDLIIQPNIAQFEFAIYQGMIYSRVGKGVMEIV